MNIKPLMDGIIVVRDEKGKVGAYDLSGALLLPAAYASIQPMGRGILCIGEEYHQYRLCRRDGSRLTDEIFYSVEPFSEGRAAVNIDKKWGFIDRSGTMVIAPQFRKLGHLEGFHEGYALVMKGKKTTFIDKTGQIAFHLPAGLEFPWHFSAGIAPLIKDGKWGFIDRSGSVVVSPQYSAVLLYDVLWMMGSSM